MNPDDLLNAEAKWVDYIMDKAVMPTPKFPSQADRDKANVEDFIQTKYGVTLEKLDELIKEHIPEIGV